MFPQERFLSSLLWKSCRDLCSCHLRNSNQSDISYETKKSRESKEFHEKEAIFYFKFTCDFLSSNICQTDLVPSQKMMDGRSDLYLATIPFLFLFFRFYDQAKKVHHFSIGRVREFCKHWTKFRLFLYKNNIFAFKIVWPCEYKIVSLQNLCRK